MVPSPGGQLHANSMAISTQCCHQCILCLWRFRLYHRATIRRIGSNVHAVEPLSTLQCHQSSQDASIVCCRNPNISS